MLKCRECISQSSSTILSLPSSSFFLSYIYPIHLIYSLTLRPCNPAAFYLCSVQVAATFYECVEREKWLSDPSVRPNMEVFMLKIFMSVAVGITGGLFLVNGRVLNNWKQFFRRVLAKKQPLPPYLQPAHITQTGRQGRQGTTTTTTGSFKSAPQVVTGNGGNNNNHHHHHFYQQRPPQESTGLADVHGVNFVGRCTPKHQHHHHHHHLHQHHLSTATSHHPLQTHHMQQHQPYRGSRNKCGSETQV